VKNAIYIFIGALVALTASCTKDIEVLQPGPTDFFHFNLYTSADTIIVNGVISENGAVSGPTFESSTRNDSSFLTIWPDPGTLYGNMPQFLTFVKRGGDLKGVYEPYPAFQYFEIHKNETRYFCHSNIGNVEITDAGFDHVYGHYAEGNLMFFLHRGSEQSEPYVTMGAFRLRKP
jgi:hypothetical protein